MCSLIYTSPLAMKVSRLWSCVSFFCFGTLHVNYIHALYEVFNTTRMLFVSISSEIKSNAIFMNSSHTKRKDVDKNKCHLQSAALTQHHSSVRTYRANIPCICAFPHKLLLYSLWLDGRSDYDSLPAEQFGQKDLAIGSTLDRKTLHQIISIVSLSSYGNHAHNYIYFVWLKKKISFDRCSPEMSMTRVFVLVCLFCSPVAAGWHRSCEGCLDNHMITFCCCFADLHQTNS